MNRFLILWALTLLAGCSEDIDREIQEEVPVEVLIERAEYGDAQAQFQLAVHHFEEQDLEKAHEFLKLSADQGNAEAQNEIGFFYEIGCEEDDFCPYKQDHAEALRWYHLSADQNESFAQYNIGKIYFKGLGVPTDYDTAYEWFMVSAENDYYCAQLKVGQMLINGLGAEKSILKGMLWIEKAQKSVKYPCDTIFADWQRDSLIDSLKELGQQTEIK